MHFALSPFQQVSCTHSMSTPLRSIRSATSLPLPVMVPTFNVATLSLIFLAFFLSSFLSFLLLHCFPPLLLHPSSMSTSDSWCPVTGNGRCFPGPRSGMKSDFTSRIEKYLAKFYAGCLSCRNPPHLSGLGTGTKAALI